MPEITVTTTATFDPRATWYEFAMLGSAVSYWASHLKVSDAGISLREHPDEGNESVSIKRSATWQEVGDAIALMASGTMIDTDGTPKRLGNEYAVRACADLIHHPDQADWDVNVDDLIMQMALLGKVVYG